MRLLKLVALILIVAALASCKIKTGGQRYEGAGIVFVVPIQTSEVRNGPFGIDYKSDRFQAFTDGHTLVVNGKPFGELNPGDVVTFSRSGTASVNGMERKPAK